jgi:energy-coupling factor transporter ATP-binding protein EcfA2
MNSLQRKELHQTLSRLPGPQFRLLVFVLKPPEGILPAETAPQADQATYLLKWAETTGPGISSIQEQLYVILDEELPVLEAVCPYKGLSYFDCNNWDYRYFYGRQALIQALLEKVAHENMVAIAGASGSGKSSVLRAGLLQQLRDQGGYEIRILVPGDKPLQNLALAFVDETADRLDRAEQQQKATRLIETGAEGLIALVQTSPTQRVVLAIDQFEEVFTLCHNGSEQQAFFATLMGALAALPSKLCLILAMRSDFVGKCLEQDYAGLADQVQAHLLSVRPMTAAELTQAITEPARQVGVSLESGLAETLLRDVDQSPGSLPLLQYALTELWQQQQDHQLRLATYAQLGGVTGTLQQRADAVYDGLSSDQQKTARHIFLNLTQLGEGSEDTRRRVRQKDLVSAQHPAEQVTAVVKQLADANLVVTDEQVGIDGEREAIVDVAHEALIRHWPNLRDWLDKSRNLLQRQRKIERDAQEWMRQGKAKGYLLQGRLLGDAKELTRIQVDSSRNELSSLTTQFIQASLVERWRRRFRITSIFAAIPVFGTLVITHFFFLNRAQSVLWNSECQQNPDIKPLLRYMLLSGHRDNLEEINLCEEDLGSINLESASLWKSDFRRSVFEYGSFKGSFLQEADFEQATLWGVDFSGANVKNAIFKGSFLYETDFSNAIGLTEEQIKESGLCETILPDDFSADPNRDCQKYGF